MLKDLLGKKILFFDGAMGTMLQKKGLKGGEIPEYLNITNPEMIISVHEEYINAGSNIITTNTFGANAEKAKDWDYDVCEIVSAAVSNVKEAEKRTGKKVFTALDIGPTGRLMPPIGDFSFEEAYEAFKCVAVAGKKAGADLVIIETMSDLTEAKAAVLAVKENTDLPVFCTMTFDDKGKTLTGSDASVAAVTLEAIGVDALGANCGLGPVQIYDIIKLMTDTVNIPVMVQPNAGLPKILDGQVVYDITSDEFADYMKKIAELGVGVLGGCCGTTPEYIKKTVEVCKGITPFIKGNNATYVTSYCKKTEIGKIPVIIGERINPTGKKKLKEALRNSDMSYIINEANAQTEAGAHILDVNVGLPEIDEKEMMEKVISAVSAATTLPLQIDSTNPEVLETALRHYTGKAIVNSVNGKQEVMDAVFPIVKKYGACVVGLALDEEGIPDTAEGRVEIAKRIINEAAKYGIDKKDILIDALTLTVSTGENEGATTLESLKKIKELGVNTVLGVSNVSFGLPKREVINSTFFTLALSNGLDACIINPCSEAMMNAYVSYLVINGMDKDCAGYISYCSDEQTSGETSSLYDIIVKGFKDLAYEKTLDELKITAPMDIINNIIIPALDFVGNEFEHGTMFLPQLMTAASAVQNAFKAIKEEIAKSGEVSVNKGNIVIATVKGDIHDIGKNIVKVLLENYGYNVIDLGRDVPEDLIVEAVKRESAQICGLSALMTTTVTSMEETIKVLRQETPDVKIMVGGAVLTQEYADMIGADSYAKDALAAVDYANKLLGY